MRILTSLLLLLVFAPVNFAQAKTNFADLYETHSKSVVTVYTKRIGVHGGQLKQANGVGSGVLIEDDQVITAAHVVDGTRVIEVQFHDGERIRADVIASVETSDVALLKLKRSPENGVVSELGDSDDTRIGSDVFIIGAPYGIEQTLSVGILSGRMNRGIMSGGNPIEFLQTDTAINTGNSGGPMFNAEGEVIGIVSFILTKSGGFDGIGFATSSNSAKQALLSSSGVLAGFEGVLLNEKVAKALNFPGAGLLVQRVNADSVVGRGGLKAGNIDVSIAGQTFKLGGDLILEINGLVCQSPHDFELIRQSTLDLSEDGVYAIKVFRDGGIEELVVGMTELLNFPSISAAH